MRPRLHRPRRLTLLHRKANHHQEEQRRDKMEDINTTTSQGRRPMGELLLISNLDNWICTKGNQKFHIP